MIVEDLTHEQLRSVRLVSQVHRELGAEKLFFTVTFDLGKKSLDHLQGISNASHLRCLVKALRVDLGYMRRYQGRSGTKAQYNDLVQCCSSLDKMRNIESLTFFTMGHGKCSDERFELVESKLTNMATVLIRFIGRLSHPLEFLAIQSGKWPEIPLEFFSTYVDDHQSPPERHSWASTMAGLKTLDLRIYGTFDNDGRTMASSAGWLASALDDLKPSLVNLNLDLIHGRWDEAIRGEEELLDLCCTCAYLHIPQQKLNDWSTFKLAGAWPKLQKLRLKNISVKASQLGAFIRQNCLSIKRIDSVVWSCRHNLPSIKWIEALTGEIRPEDLTLLNFGQEFNSNPQSCYGTPPADCRSFHYWQINLADLRDMYMVEGHSESSALEAIAYIVPIPSQIYW